MRTARRDAADARDLAFSIFSQYIVACAEHQH
jgi:hypothetical protein